MAADWIYKMPFKYVRTGPFNLEKIIEDVPSYLRLVFDDLDQNGNKNIRSLRKGGDWPNYFSDLLLEKSKKINW